MAVDGVDPHIDQSLPLTRSCIGRGKLRDGKAPGTSNIGEELPKAEGEAMTSCCTRPRLLLFQQRRQLFEMQRKNEMEIHQSIVLLISNRVRAHKRGRFQKRRYLDAFLKDKVRDKSKYRQRKAGPEFRRRRDKRTKMLVNSCIRDLNSIGESKSRVKCSGATGGGRHAVGKFKRSIRMKVQVENRVATLQRYLKKWETVRGEE